MSEAKKLKKRRNDEGTPRRTPRRRKLDASPESSMLLRMEVLLPEENDENWKDLIFHRVREEAFNVNICNSSFL